MIKRSKSKRLFAIFIDFAFIILLFGIVIGLVLVSKSILYPEKDVPKALSLRTEFMPSQYRTSLSLGDEVFDTLTKRKLGRISDVEIMESGDDICFYITVDAEFTPRSRALRTKNLWFYFIAEDQ